MSTFFSSLKGGGGMFGSACLCDITLDAEPNRKTASLGKNSGGERAYVFTDGEDVRGTAVVSIQPGKKVEHQGIRVELVAAIDSGAGASGYEFFCISKDLEGPGTLFETRQFKWEFRSVDKQCESYYGTNVRLRYFVRLTVNSKGYGSNVTKEVDFVVQNLFPAPEINNSIKMEVGIEDCLHIEFEYERSKLHLKDVVVGKVFFLLVRIKIKHMELNINRTEITGGGGDKQVSDKETLTKFEIMDGAPVKDQCIPVRFYLTGTELTPSFNNVQNKFSVKYFLSVVIIDEEDRRYFKQSEVFLYRKKIG